MRFLELNKYHFIKLESVESFLYTPPESVTAGPEESGRYPRQSSLSIQVAGEFFTVKANQADVLFDQLKELLASGGPICF